MNRTPLAVALELEFAQQYGPIFRHLQWAEERGTSVGVVTVHGSAELALAAAPEGVERLPVGLSERAEVEEEPQIGRASCRERVCAIV